MKLADVTPVYKEKSKSSKGNYRPVNVVPNISKIYERCSYDQILLFFDSLFSKNQSGFHRSYNAQQCWISLIEKWTKSVDNGGAFGALLTHLSKAFGCLPHDLLIAKLDAYGSMLASFGNGNFQNSPRFVSRNPKRNNCAQNKFIQSSQKQYF